MEKEGLHRIMEFMKGENLKVGVLVTDRHRQINLSHCEALFRCLGCSKRYVFMTHHHKFSVIIKFCYSERF